MINSHLFYYIKFENILKNELLKFITKIGADEIYENVFNN